MRLAVCLVFLVSASLASEHSAASSNEKSNCCGTVKLDSGGMAGLYQGDRLGNYRMTHVDFVSGRPVYQQINGNVRGIKI